MSICCKIELMNKNPQKIKEMFNSIAKDYDRNNNIISFGLHSYVKKCALEKFNFYGKCLDLCTGTGDIAGLLSKTCDVTGLDFSEEMLKIARKKYSNIEFIEGDCTDLQFDDNTFDIVTISFGLRNIEDYNKALDEIYRVLKPEGLFFHLDFAKENFIANIIYDFAIPGLIKLFYKNNLPYKYLVQSKKEFFNSESLTKLFTQHNFIFLEKNSFLMNTIACQLFKK